MTLFIAYAGALSTMLVLDALWLMVLAKNFYVTRMGHIFMEQIKFAPVIIFYPLYALAVTFLCIMPALETGSALSALWRGALLGLAAYGAYDFTNHATIANWPTIMTLVDLSWGICVTALASVGGYYIVSYFS